MNPTDALKVTLAFVNAFAGVFAGYPGTDLDPMIRLAFVALVAGCGAALLFLNPPGKSGEKFSPKQVDQLTDALIKKSGKAG